MKICSKCKIKKDLSEFSVNIKYKDNLFCWCKKCVNKYHNKYDKKYYKENKKTKLNQNKKWTKNNKNKRNKINKKHQNNKVIYDTYALRISYTDKVKNIDGFLQTKCTYCGKWYFPTVQKIQDRIRALNGQVGKGGAENRLYCSDECKQACPIYGQIKYPKGFKNYSKAREVQPELRQMVFERDEYTCIKCGKHQNDLNVPLHCHHIEGIKYNPIESADIDICVTVCKICHNKIHQQNGCGYNDMKCKK